MANPFDPAYVAPAPVDGSLPAKDVRTPPAATPRVVANPAYSAPADGVGPVAVPKGPPPPTTRTQLISSASRASGFGSGLQSDGTVTALNSVKWFLNDSGKPATDLRPWLPGWLLASGASGETANNGNLTASASLEYPANTRTAYTWGGAPSGTVVAGFLSYAPDPLPISVPAGAWFAIHLYVTCTAGTKWGLAPCATNFGGGRADFYETGAAGVLADKTLSGAPAGTADGYFPAMVTGVVEIAGARAPWSSMGDSINGGAGDGNYDAANNTSGIGRGMTGVAPLLHMAVTGTTMQSQLGKMAGRLDLLVKGNIKRHALTYASNDIAGGRSAAALMADWQTAANAIVTAVPNAQVYSATVISRLSGTSADKWESIGTQTVAGGGFTAGAGSVRAVYNALVRSKPEVLTDYFEWADSLDVDSTNTPTRDGGFLLVGPSSRLEGPAVGLVQSGATTTVIPTNVIRGSNYWASFSGGYVRFTSGALAGTLAAISSSDASGGITLVTALGSAPANGDGISLTSARCASSNDGIHPNITDFGAPFGSYYRLRDVTAAKLASL